MRCCLARHGSRAVSLLTVGSQGREAGQQLFAPLALCLLIGLNNNGLVLPVHLALDVHPKQTSLSNSDCIHTYLART